MCGIFGVTELEPGHEIHARKALHTLTHRGPDQWGEYVADGLYIGHRRLSILDLSEAGRQPMQSCDGTVVVSANGEIYNFRELRRQLEPEYQFRSNSDTEVLLHGYRKWGLSGLLSRIEGMYAFALYDVSAQKLYLVRDRVGIKPLFFAQLGSRFGWASELKALEYYFGAELKVDPTALYDFLTHLYIPAPKSLYKNVFKLEPAHYLEWDFQAQRAKTTRYWELNPSPRKIGIKEAIDAVHHAVVEAVNREVVSDVPLGFFLSGGIDSSAVVASAAAGGTTLNTFTVRFQGGQKDESMYAGLVAQKFGTSHHLAELSSDEVRQKWNMLRQWYDEPFGDTSAFPSYLVCREARKDVTVVLTGDGGDEVFGGYRWYQRNARRIPWRRNLGWLKHVWRHLPDCVRLHHKGEVLASWFAYDEIEAHAWLLGGLSTSVKRAIAKDWNIPKDYDDYWAFRKYWRPDLSPFTRFQYLDFHTYLPDDILTKVDRVSMAVSLEARVPLLSRSVVELAFSVSEEIRIPSGEPKGLLKYAFKDSLPPEILNRPKQGFSIPGDFMPPGKRAEHVLEVFCCEQGGAS